MTGCLVAAASRALCRNCLEVSPQVVALRLQLAEHSRLWSRQQVSFFFSEATTTNSTTSHQDGSQSSSVNARSYGIQAGYHRFFYPAGYPGGAEKMPSPFSTKDAISVLVSNLRHSPVETAQEFAKCLTPAERGAIIYALRTKSNQEGIHHLEEAFLEADSNMDGKLSREEFVAYLTVRAKKASETAHALACRPTNQQLLTTAIASGIPFVGFGFCDNAIMLMAGERIEASLGVAFGITTLAAAGLGNLISDVVGLGLADTIEVYARRFGVKEPSLNKEQLRLTITRATRTTGAVIGVVVGCLLGMIPLLFFDGKTTVKECCEKGENKDSQERKLK